MLLVLNIILIVITITQITVMGYEFADKIGAIVGTIFGICLFSGILYYFA